MSPPVVDRPHARISPSGFARVEACTMSLVLGANAPPRVEGSDALRGTAGHALFEQCVEHDLEAWELGDVQSVQVRRGPDTHDVPWTPDDTEQLQLALDALRGLECLQGRTLEVEAKLELGVASGVLGEPVYGYADVLARERLPAVVVDLKLGFQPVGADSDQLMIYLLMVLLAMPGLSLEHGDDDDVLGVTVVLQPATAPDVAKIKEWTRAELRAGLARVLHTLRRVREGDYTYSAGDHCKWCPAIGACPHLMAVARDAPLARISPTPELVASGELSAERLDEMLALAPVLDEKIRALWRVAEDYMLHGGLLKNAKLVRQRRPDRAWRDEAAVPGQLEALGIEDPYQPRKLISPTQAEKQLPASRRKTVETMVADRPEGGLTAAPVSDKRAAVDVGARLRAVVEATKASALLAPHRGEQKR